MPCLYRSRLHIHPRKDVNYISGYTSWNLELTIMSCTFGSFHLKVLQAFSCITSNPKISVIYPLDCINHKIMPFYFQSSYEKAVCRYISILSRQMMRIWHSFVRNLTLLISQRIGKGKG